MDYWLLLHSIQGMGAATFNKLLERFGTPEKVFSTTLLELASIPKLGKKLIKNILSQNVGINLQKMDKIIAELKKKKFKVITKSDENYPKRLGSFKNLPPIIYVYGKLPQGKSIAIIGARQASSSGLKRAFKFAQNLAKAGFTIVSGYAKGIDTQAHLGAIKGGGETIMVIPMGVFNFVLHKELYPVKTQLLKRGTILSEFFPTASWTIGQAMARNRLTSGLSDAVLIIEAGPKGGTINTANWAKKQGKPIFVCAEEGKIPGAKVVKEPEQIICAIRG